MAIRPTKTDAKKLIELLDREWDDAESLAMAVMEKSFEVYASKAKFAVAGQTWRHDNPAFKGTPNNGLVLDLFSTEKQALSEALKLTNSNANPTEPHQAWVLPVYHGTAHAYHSSRKKEREATRRGVTSTDRLVALIRSQDSVRRCPKVELDEDSMEFVQCVHYLYHPYECHYDEDMLPRCDRKVAIPDDCHEMAPCSAHQYHYGPCLAEVRFHGEEQDD